jgi:hypothetical protein
MQMISTYDGLIETNNRFMHMVTEYKNKITQFHDNRCWDKYKKVSNEYELIFTTPYAKHNVSLYNPVSRSFFKMWELLHDFTDDILPQYSNDSNNSNNSISPQVKCLFLAEGPGGFLEAVMKYRNNKNDHYYGMTLRPEQKSVPEWKLKKFEGLSMSQITTLYGVDDTGDLYNLDNTHHIASELGMNVMDLVTADGGFDFSSNFNGQEDLSSKLIKCEIYCALHMLKDKGTFILKIYDMFHYNTLLFLQTLYNSFEYIYITKPFTSRPANSEKYLVCCGYNVANGHKNIPILRDYITCSKNNYDVHAVEVELLYNIAMYNAYYTSRQVFYIQKTIDIICQYESLKQNERYQKQDIVIAKNKEKCRNWCLKYNIPCVTSL